ncbi:MAG TPA: nucleoside hydrolase [Mycobacteriales bacterium]
MQIHLDTDLGGDTDDTCALAMLLGWPDVDVVGITTTIDPGGRRAGYVRHCLDLAGRSDIPVVAGAEVSLSTLRTADPIIDDDRYWPTGIAAYPAPPGAALDLLAADIDAGATVVAIGPYTNLALLEVARPGSLARNRVVAMGGWIRPPADGLPAWGPDMDWNVQWDTRAAQIVAATASLTLATLPATMHGQVRAADLPRLRACGPLGELVARQCAAHGADYAMGDMGKAHTGLADDLLNFQYDPVACAVALGWPGAVLDDMHLRTIVDNGQLRFEQDPGGRPTRVLVDVDGAALNEVWLTAVERAARRGA